MKLPPSPCHPRRLQPAPVLAADPGLSVAPVHALDTNDQAPSTSMARRTRRSSTRGSMRERRLRAGIGNDTELSLEGDVGDDQLQHVSTANARRVRGPRRHADQPRPRRGVVHRGHRRRLRARGRWFAAIDGGISVGYDNCYFVPVASASIFASQPLTARAVDVTVDSDKPMTSTPARTAGATFRRGFRVSLSPSACHARHQVAVDHGRPRLHDPGRCDLGRPADRARRRPDLPAVTLRPRCGPRATQRE